MANFGQLVLTNLGIQEQYKAQSGGQLKFKRIGMGSGTYSGNIAALKKLVSENVSIDISKGYMQNNAYMVEGFFSNESLQTGFAWREIGLFVEDENGNEVLYCYANAGDTYDYIPATTDERYSKYIRIATAIGNATNISIVENENFIGVDVKTFNATVEELQTEMNQLHPSKSVVGNAIAITDSANQPFVGMNIYGKSKQDGTPTPDAPVEIVSCGDGGSIATYFYGKCLADFSNLSKTGDCVFSNKGNHIHYENNSGEVCYVKTGKILLPPGTYTAYIKNVVSKNNNYTLGIQSSTKSYYLHATQKTFTFEVENTDNFSLQITTDNTTDLDVWEAYVGIVCGKVSIEECPEIDTEIPIPQSMVLQIPNALNGLKVTSNGNYTDAHGQQWLCDEIDFTHNKLIKRLTTIDFNGAVGVRKEFPVGSGYYRFDFVLSTNKDFVKGISNFGMCSALTFSGKPLSLNDLDNSIACYNGGGVYVRCDRFDNVDDFVLWANTINLKVVYALETPIETELTDEQIAAYKALTSYNPNTTILNDGGADMNVEYVTKAFDGIMRLAAKPQEISASDIKSGILPIEFGGTGADNAEDALKNLGIASDVLRNINKHYWKRQAVEATVEPMWSEPKAVQRVLGSSGSAENTFKFYTSTNVKCTFNTETKKCELSLDSPREYSSTYGNAGNTSAYFKGKYWSFASDGSAPIYYSESDSSVSGGWLSGTGYHITVSATLVRGVVRTIGEIEYLHSESADTYPVGIQDGYLYTYIGIPEENLINSKKAVYGSYVGTGTFGSDSENELFFDTIPDVIMVTGGYLLPKIGTGIRFGGALSDHTLIVRTEGNTVYWYGDGAEWQLNYLNVVYKYVAI